MFPRGPQAKSRTTGQQSRDGRKGHGALAAPVSPEQDGVWRVAWHLSPGWGHKCLGQVLKPVAQGRPLSTNTEKPQGQVASLESILPNKEIMPIILKCFQKNQEEGSVPNSFHEDSVTLIPKSIMTQRKRELLAKIPTE